MGPDDQSRPARVPATMDRIMSLLQEEAPARTHEEIVDILRPAFQNGLALNTKDPRFVNDSVGQVGMKLLVSAIIAINDRLEEMHKSGETDPLSSIRVHYTPIAQAIDTLAKDTHPRARCELDLGTGASAPMFKMYMPSEVSVYKSSPTQYPPEEGPKSSA